MSDDSTPQPEASADSGQGQLMLERLYLKDASFESPRSPAVFDDAWKPEFQLDINTRTNRMGDTRFEVVLSATLRARDADDKTIYIVEVQHAGVFSISGLDKDGMQRVLGTLCPATLFPYVRENVDSLVVKGGFPAVHLAPVNFETLFAEAVRRQSAEAGAQPTQH